MIMEQIVAGVLQTEFVVNSFTAPLGDDDAADGLLLETRGNKFHWMLVRTEANQEGFGPCLVQLRVHSGRSLRHTMTTTESS